MSTISYDCDLKRYNDFKIAAGKKWADVLGFYDSTNVVISDRVKMALEDHNVRGWGSFPINIIGFEDKKYHAFFPVTVAGKITNLEAIFNYETEKREFDVSTWNGDEVFTNAETLNIVCTEKVKDLLESIKATNIEFSPY
ncbi:hypothetical protein [Marinicella sp. W31]|uniref:hypothetical protein n=1 Tax=Marinicella sp. W31 TaxID=3023713 RepID=UPI0037568224